MNVDSSLQWAAMVRWYQIFNRSVEAKVRILSLYIAGEERAEISPLLPLARKLPDCELKRLVKRHLAEEGQHSKLLRARIKELGGSLYPIHSALEPQEFFFKRGGNLDDWLEQDAAAPLTRESAIKALLFNAVLESSGCTGFMAHAEAVREVDPRTYFMFMRILPDELRHATYTLEYAYRLAGQDLRDFTIETHRGLLEAQSKYWSKLMGLILTHLIPREVVKMGRLEYGSWKAIAKAQERQSLKHLWVFPQPMPERLTTLAPPYGYTGDDDVTRLIQTLPRQSAAA